MSLLLQVIWFLVPAGVANLVPPIAARLLPRWIYPMDFNLTLRGQRVLGAHKTMRGLICGTVSAFGVHQLQILAALKYDLFSSLAFSKQFHELWWLGPWLGFTALSGDAIKSFIKRQWHISPGQPWLPWDKIDWIIGVLAGSWFFLHFSLTFIAVAMVTGLLLSTIGRIIGYWLKINQEWL